MSDVKAKVEAKVETKPELHLSVQFAIEKSPALPTRAELRKWAAAALQVNADVTLRLVDLEEGQQLNRDYRGKDYATNVLTFTYDEDDFVELPEAIPLSGDIVLCAPVVEREAAEQGKSLAAHYAHLTIHGMLHLQGYDHETEADAVTMEAVESFIVQHLGYPDPYQNHD